MKKFPRDTTWDAFLFSNVVTKTQQVICLLHQYRYTIHVYNINISIYIYTDNAYSFTVDIHKICQINNQDQDQEIQEIQEYHYFNFPSVFSLVGKVPVRVCQKKCTHRVWPPYQCKTSTLKLQIWIFNSYAQILIEHIVCKYIL